MTPPPLRRIAAALALCLLAPVVPLDAQEGGEAAETTSDTVAAASAAELRSLADSVAGSLISARKTAGLSVMIVRGADTLVHAGHGKADLELGAPATATTVYRVGSVTKQFTAALVQTLAAAGTLSVEDPLSRWLEVPPAWRSTERPVTLRHLLTHTSGIPSYTGDDEFWSRAALPLAHDEVLDFVRDDSLEFTPGTDWSYSNTGYYLLGMVVEEATGRRYDRVLRDSLLAPLGLEATRYCWQAPLVEGRAEGYTRSDSVPGMGRLEEERLVNARQLSMAPPFAAGALCSTVGDLVTWTRALHAGDVLPRAETGEMTTRARLAGGDTTHYGFGLSVGEVEDRRRIAHGGGINGFSAVLAHYPTGEGPGDDLTVAVLVNSDAASAGEVEEPLARAALGIPPVEVDDRPVSAALAERLTGRYVVGGRLPAEVRRRDGRLYADPEGQPEFRLLFQGVEDTDEGRAAVFRAGFDPEGVKLEFLLPDGTGASSPAFVLHQGGATLRAEREDDPGGDGADGGP